MNPDETQPAVQPSSRLQQLLVPGVLALAVCVGLWLATAPMRANKPAEVTVPAVPPTAAPEPVRELVPPLADDTPVIGVSMNGRHRAYALSDLWRPADHVLNDMWDDVPVTVTFCNLGNCVRSYTGNLRNETLRIQNGGANPLRPRTMLLKVGNTSYEQETGVPVSTPNSPPSDGTPTPFPFETTPSERTTWGEWKAKHPDTEARVAGRLYPARAPAKP
jgi:hypothetical protein